MSNEGPSMESSNSWIIKYHSPLDGTGLFIRGLRPDRSFYGESAYSVGDSVQHKSVHGQISDRDFGTIQRLAAQIGSQTHSVIDIARSVGVLAHGPMSSPNVLFRLAGNEAEGVHGEATRAFMEIVKIMLSYAR